MSLIAILNQALNNSTCVVRERHRFDFAFDIVEQGCAEFFLGLVGCVRSSECLPDFLHAGLDLKVLAQFFLATLLFELFLFLWYFRLGTRSFLLLELCLQRLTIGFGCLVLKKFDSGFLLKKKYQ